MKRLALLAFASGLLACGGGSKSDTAATGNPCGGDPCADPCADPGAANPCEGGGADAGIDWSGWESWTKVNNAAFVSAGHKKPWVNVYVPAEHVEAYKAGGGEMPQGFAVVKSIHADNGGAAGDVQVLTVMAKMGPDYDPDNGNWYYAAMSPDGSKIMQEGKLEACLNCHSSGDDYLFPGDVVGK